MYLHKLGNDEKLLFHAFALHLVRLDDQRVDAREKAALEYMRAEMGMGSKSAGDGDPLEPAAIAATISSDADRRIFIVEAFNICFANGLLHAKQRRLISEVAQAFEMSEIVVTQAEAICRKKSEIMMEFDRLVTP